MSVGERVHCGTQLTRARLTELAENIVADGADKVLTKNGACYAALTDAQRLDYYQALEAEHANLVLVEAAIKIGRAHV